MRVRPPSIPVQRYICTRHRLPSKRSGMQPRSGPGQRQGERQVWRSGRAQQANEDSARAGRGAPPTSASAAAPSSSASTGSAASRWASLAPSPSSSPAAAPPETPRRADAASSRWAPRQQAPAPTPRAPALGASRPVARPTSTSSNDGFSRGGARSTSGDITRGPNDGLRRRADGEPLGGLVNQMALLASPSRGLDSKAAALSIDGTTRT